MKPPAAFDDYAADYDQHFTESSIGRYQRMQVWDFFNPLLKAPKRILEINCGTGFDAFRLAREGHQVTATDASAEMIAQARRRLDHQEPAQNPQFQVCVFADLLDRFKPRQFDLIFSNFGGLNCIDPLATARLSLDLSHLLKNSGNLFLVYMSSNCLWEKWYYRYKGDRSKARRRRSSEPAIAQIAGRQLPIWYYSPAELQRLFEPAFLVTKARPIGLFVPPSYLEGYFRNKDGVVRRLHWLDTRINSGKLANFADHFAIILQKKS